MRVMILATVAILLGMTPALASIVVIDTPEPLSLAILAVGAAGAVVARRLRRRR